MIERLYYWAENSEDYSSDNDKNDDKIIEIRRLNFFIGKNNAGKSRFLRSLFTTTIKFEDINSVSLINELTELQRIINNVYPRNVGYQNSYGGDYKNQLLKLINEILEPEEALPLLKLKTIIDKNLSEINKYFDNTNKDKFKSILENYYVNSKIHYEKYSFKNKLYLPILRGMRPVSHIENTQPYIERTQKDYFTDLNKFNAQNIITGECLYHELKIHLLGEPEQRDLIKNYERKLSQYFFENETITLIPKHDQDVVNIKIGNEPQFPISQLGDGLQQVIILTYEAFIKNSEINSFFIEEPELHMHAGMVRQLMNFYLNETNHYYFFTTHSNHLLDMADESDQVIIQKFVKEPNKEDSRKFDFKIYRCDRDRDLLASLGVKPSSVYLANCTIWVEGITDRLYITKYMEKYLAELEKSDISLYQKYRRFMPNYHYTFVEYAGSNLTHWSFSDNYVDNLDDKGLSAKAVASEMLLIADGDIKDKADRVKVLQSELNKGNYFILDCKETENTLPKDSIVQVAFQRFNRMHSKTKESYDISLIHNITDENYFDHNEYGIGKLLDTRLKKPSSKSQQTLFADGHGVGTIKNKLEFCRETIRFFDENPNWQLTKKAKELCERVFKHIEKCNL